MMNRLLRNTLTCALLFAAADAHAVINTCALDSGNRAVADSFNERWQRALGAHDEKQLRELYAESAVLMPPSDETLVGREPISAYLNSANIPAREANYTLELVSCELRGDTLHITAVWGTPGADGVATGTWQSGNLLRVLAPERDGRWVSAYEIWN